MSKWLVRMGYVLLVIGPPIALINLPQEGQRLDPLGFGIQVVDPARLGEIGLPSTFVLAKFVLGCLLAYIGWLLVRRGKPTYLDSA